MPLPLLAIGAGMAATGLVGGLFSSRRVLDEGDLDYDPERMALGRYEELTAPGHGLGQFQRLAATAAPRQSDMLNVAALSGGSGAAAQAQYLAERGRGREQALGAYGQFRLANEQNAQGYLGMEYDRSRFVKQGLAEDALGARNARMSLFSNLVSGGAGILGGALANDGMGAKTASSAGSTSQGFGKSTPVQYGGSGFMRPLGTAPMAQLGAMAGPPIRPYSPMNMQPFQFVPPGY